MKKRIAILLCGAVLLGCLGGCRNNTGDTYTPTGNGLTWDEDYTGATVETQQQQEQNLTLIYYSEETLNPYLSTDFTNRALFSLLYQSLFTVDRDYHIEPMLCKNYRVSEDMKSYTFYVNEATFSDGTAITGGDVAASLNAARNSAVYKGRFTHVKDIVLANDGGVQINLNIPCENLPVLLDIPILKESHVALDRPLGTGPYYLEESGETALLRRRTNWWCRANMTVTAEAIALMKAKDNAQIRDSFEFSGLNLVCADPGSDKYADYRCDYELWDCENNIFLYLACNMESQVFSNPEVRSALTYAIDRDTLTESYYRGFARSASLPASPLSPWYNSTLASRYAYDGGEKFAQAVKDASMTGMPIVLLANSDDSLRLRVAKEIGAKLRESGLTVTVSALGTSAYKKALQEGEYDLYLGQTKLSPNMDLSNFFTGKGSLSYGGLGDVALYTKCTEALANYGNFYTLHQAVMTDGRLCPILFRSYAVYATRGLLTGLTPARDNIFYYSLGRSMEKCKLS